METVNLLLIGIGGQGVLTASEVIAEAAFLQGYDVKKSEVHGMSQRGGGVSSHLRFGDTVYSPLIPNGQADFLLAFNLEEGEKYRYMLKPSGVMIEPGCAGEEAEGLGQALNIYLLGVLSHYLSIDPSTWQEAIRRCVKSKFLDLNLKAFDLGRECPALRRNTT